MTNAKMTEQVRNGRGFIAALDQSGGSTPKALKLYGVSESEYSGEEAMFDMIHAMRARIIKSPAFTGDKVVGAILFEQTMDRTIDGVPTATYLWDKRHVVPFLKIDKGLEAEADGVQLMKPMPGLDALLARAVKAGIYGTKERSVVNAANRKGIAAVVAQQFEIGRQVAAQGLMPILEPEVTISIADKAEAEAILQEEILKALEGVEGQVMLKLSLPTDARISTSHWSSIRRCLRSWRCRAGIPATRPTRSWRRTMGSIASFSRALERRAVERPAVGRGVRPRCCKGAVDGIYAASIT